MNEVNTTIIQKITAYLNSCYQADNREHSLWDLFSDKNELLKLANCQQLDDLKTRSFCYLDADYGSRLAKNVVMYRREKMLLFGRWFVFAQLPISSSGLSSKTNRICAPLLLYEASLHESSQQHQLQIERTMVRWNSPLLSILFDDKDIELRLDGVLNDQWTLDGPGFLKRLQSSSVIKQCDLALEINNTEDLQAGKNNSRKHHLTLAPGGCFVLTKRSTSSRGVIDELNAMSATDRHSEAISSLFKTKLVEKWRSNRCQPDYVPGLLSHSQERALYNAARKNLSVLIGPPGTGKSYTIACIMLERFLQGESVLLVTRNESAVDVIQEKLVEQLGICANATIRSGSKDYHQELKNKLADILGGMLDLGDGKQHHKALHRIMKKIKRVEQQFINHAQSAVSDGLFLDTISQGELKAGWFNWFKQWLIARRVKISQSLYAQLKAIHELHATREALLAKHINARYQLVLKEMLSKNREQLAQFDSALRARTSLGQSSRFLQVDHQLLLKALPIWLSSLSALHRSLPMKAELFDLVIIDEATQCDMASCLPALYRAKRAMVVGDPKQLRHLSFLSAKKQQQLFEKHDLYNLSVDLNYRDQSMIDLAIAQVDSQDAVVMLDEHYRSVPEIIGFSNQQFYQSHLKIMTAKPTTNQKPAIRLVEVPDGMRNLGVNDKEVDVLMKQLDTVLGFQQHLPPQYRQSIGILSFFRQQSEAIKERLIADYSTEILTTHKIRVSTPYGFQGEERDIMLISCGVCPKTIGSTFHYLNRPDVFNVAVTRARDLQYLFISVPLDEMPADGLLTAYVDYVNHLSTNDQYQIDQREKNVSELCAALNQVGITTIQNYIVAGVAMDLMVIEQGHALAIDLIGFPGEFQDVLHIERYHIFARAELIIYPLSLGRWMMFKEQVVKEIKQLLSDLHMSSIENISVAYQIHFWKKINVIDSLLAKRVREVEHQLLVTNSHKGMDQLKSMVNLYCQLRYLLAEKLNPGELTSMRYNRSFTEIFNACLDRWMELINSSSHMTTTAVEAIYEDNQQALDKLKETQIHLQKLKVNGQTSTSRSASHLSELDDLNQNTRYFYDENDI